MALTRYELGEVAQIDFTVRDSSGNLVTAANVTAEVRKPDGTTDDITTLVALRTPLVGTYRILLPLNQPGDWNIEIETTDPDDAQRFPLYVQPNWVDTSALNANALTTLSKARLHVLRNVTQTDQDELLALLINGASMAIYNYTNREFKPTGDEPVARTLSYDGDGMLPLSPWELREATAVALLPAGSTTQQTLAAIDYRLEPAQRTPEGTYLSLRFPASLCSYGLGHTVTITGEWGMAAVPADVELACLIAVADGFRNPGSMTSYSTAGGFTSGEPLSGPSGSLPIGARRLLYPYRRQRRVGSFRLSRPRDIGYRGGLPTL